MIWGSSFAVWLRQKSRNARQWIYELVVPAYKTKVVIGDLPETLEPRTLFIVEDDGYREQAALLCPCGCGRILHLNLLPDDRPLWRVTEHPNGTASLHPSVWRKKDCGSHFWFRKGRVHWVRPHR